MGGAWEWIKAGERKEVKDLISHLAFHFSVQVLNFELNSDHERVMPLLMLARSGGSKAEALLSVQTVRPEAQAETQGPQVVRWTL